MKKTLLILLVLLVDFGCSKTEDSVTPQQKSIVEAVYASGSIHPINEYKVFANATGILRNIHVQDGDSVEINQSLFEIEARDPQLRLQSAREALVFAQSNASNESAAVAELRSNVESTKAKYVSDSLSFVRSRDLLALSAVTRAEHERVSSSFESSRALWLAATARLTSTKLSLRNQLNSAQRQFEIAKTSERNFSVQSLYKGRVFSVAKQEGEMVSNQQPIMVIGDADQFTLRLVVDASDVVKIQPGQKVLYTVDAFPDSSFHATVMKVFPTLENETQSFRVDARCDQKPPVPFVGTQVQANIIVSQKNRALVIPRSYLQSGNQVIVQEGRKTKIVKVQCGISNLEYVEILSGLDEHSTIVHKQ